MKSVGCTTMEISLPTELSLSLISSSLKKRFKCRALISVIVHVEKEEEEAEVAPTALLPSAPVTGEGVKDVNPAVSANPPRSICLISAVLPSRTIPKDSPSRLRLIMSGFPCGMRWMSSVIVSVSFLQCLIIFCAEAALATGSPLTLMIRSPM